MLLLIEIILVINSRFLGEIIRIQTGSCEDYGFTSVTTKNECEQSLNNFESPWDGNYSFMVGPSTDTVPNCLAVGSTIYFNSGGRIDRCGNEPCVCRK